MAIRRASIIGGIGSPGGGATNARVARQTGTFYPSSVTRTIDEKVGDRLSVFDFGAVGDGTTDDAAAFNAAIAAAISLGHGVTVYAPSATYAIGAAGIVFPSTSVPITLEGDGLATIIKRTGTMPSGQGVIDIQACSDITLRNFTVDGQVTTSVGVLYSTVGGNAMLAALTANTSIWVHGPSARIRLQGLNIQHTGGYAVLFDCSSGLLQDMRVLDCLLQNNRPHLFGTSGGDLNYGSWTGGIFVNGDGTTYGADLVLKDFLVRGCTFRRMTGNCLWSHLNTALNDLHSNFRWCQNHFEDIGLDGMGVNGVTGGVVEGNTVRRNGYICSDDTSPSTPKYLSGAYSVGLDTAGIAKGVAYKGNSFTSPNGAAMDLDGYADGVVSGNVVRVPVSGEPEYTEDQIAVTGPGGTGNVSYGAQTSNTNNVALAGSGVQIVGNTFMNLSGGAIRLYAARNCQVSGNIINHPDAPVIQPIVLGNIGTGPYQRAYDNVVDGNQIVYNPASPAACVYEDASIAAFSSGDTNWVAENRIIGNGNAFEFQKNSVTSSVTVLVHSTQDLTSTVSQTRVERQGVGNTALTRWYGMEGTTKTLLMDLQHKLYNSTPTVIGGPLLNMSANGGAGTGSISTGSRTTLAFDDCMATSRSVVDGFFALTDTTFTYPNDAAADLLPASWGLIRFNSGSGIFEQSVSLSGGHRVWTAFSGGSTSPAGSNTQVQYNNTGAFGASANFTFNASTQLLTVTATGSGAAGIACATGYIQSDAGFYATSGTATSYQSVNVPGGGVYAKSLRAINYTQIGNSSGTPTVTTGDTFVAGAMYFDTGATLVKIYDGSSWVSFGASGVSSLNTLTGALSIVGTANQITVTPSGSNITLSTPQDIATTSNVNFGSVVVPNSTGYFGGKDTGGATRIMLSYASDNNVYLDNPKASQDVYIRPATSRYIFMGRASAEFVCPNGDLTADLGTAAFRWGSLHVNSIVFSSSGGYSGGTGINVSGATITNTGVTGLTAGTGISVSGSTGSITITNTSPGVTYTAGTGVSIVSNVISIGQAVGTGNTVNFTALQIGGSTVIDSSRNAAFLSLTINGNSIVSSAGEIQSPATGTSIAFQTANTNIQINGNGVVSCQQLNVAGVTTIDGSRNIACNAVVASIYDIAGGYFGQDATGGLVCGSHTLYFKGGILYSYT